MLVDVDTLVPTHDAEGGPIPEWKRQVMVRRLHARLSEEQQQQKVLCHPLSPPGGQNE